MSKLDALGRSTERPKKRSRLRRALVGYCAGVVAAAIGALLWSLAHDSLMACAADGYGSDWYLAYCDVGQYGDYEHGALFLGLEQRALRSMSDADVVFLGNSRTQFAFSAVSVSRWFSAEGLRYYVLGFGYGENSAFAKELLARVTIRPSVVVINVDPFFSARMTVPAHTVARDKGALVKYAKKRLLQTLHHEVCSNIPGVCGHSFAIYRSRLTGAWKAEGRDPGQPAPVAETSEGAQPLGDRLALGREFLARLPVQPGCVVMTVVPNARTDVATGREIAAALGFSLVEPHVDGLMTSDGSHLDSTSSERWAAAFLDAIGPTIRRCAAGRSPAQPASFQAQQ